jgi:hypothetical protein
VPLGEGGRNIRLVETTLVEGTAAHAADRLHLLEGAFYMLVGATWYMWPGSVQVLMRAPPFQSVGEVGLVRSLGMLLAVIGYLYIFGARTGQDRFGVATILDRLLVPVLLVPLVIRGELTPQAGLPFAVIDPVLGIGAWVVYSRNQAKRATT